MHRRDLIVIGTSMGGLDTLRRLLAQLPADLAAGIVIVQHTSPHRESLLAGLLNRAGSPLLVTEGTDGEEILNGHVYLAPADHHILISGRYLRVGRGPRENRSRPAIDPLFRTAACAGRGRTIGIVLTGLLDDGAAGLAAIKLCGGVTIVQDPKDAEHSSMPQQAMRACAPDYVVALAQMGSLLSKLIQESRPAPPPVPEDIALEANMTLRALDFPDLGNIHDTAKLGNLSPYTCPDCGGSLWQMGEEERYRCHVGHAHSLTSLVSGQDENLERALWAAVRSLEERQKTFERLADNDEKRGQGTSNYRERAGESKVYARRIRETLLAFSKKWAPAL